MWLRMRLEITPILACETAHLDGPRYKAISTNSENISRSRPQAEEKHLLEPVRISVLSMVRWVLPGGESAWTSILYSMAWPALDLTDTQFGTSTLLADYAI